MMSDCLGISALGLCAYDPTNPPNVYFSIGEATAALSITLIIPQFLRPIYRFRLGNQFIQLTHLYTVVFLGAGCVLIAAVLPNIGIPRGLIFSYPVFWEFTSGIFFLIAFGALVLAALWPARARRGAYPRFARGAAEFLAHANEGDRLEFSKDLLWNIQGLLDTARFIEWRRDQSAFFEFRYRREIEDARYAWSLLQLVAEPQFCETLVHRCPWDAAAMLHRISNKRLASKAAEGFVREIGRQAIICPSSMMGREIGYKGFHAAPVLSQALFGDLFINKYYQPISGLEFNDFENVDKSTVDRLMDGLRSTLTTALDNGGYWNNYSLAKMADHLESVTRDAHRQVRIDKSNYQLVLSIEFGLTNLIDDAVTHLGTLDQATYNKLYANFEPHGDMILDCISDTIINVLNTFANDFEGYEDVFWSISIHIIKNIFDKYGDQPDGMNPLQQKLAIRLIDGVKDNMNGYYPTLTRILLSVIGPYDEAENKNPNSAFSMLKKAFYVELLRFPKLYESDPEKALQFLPRDVRYDAENVAFVKTYRLGKEIATKLRNISNEPVSFEVVRRNSNR